MGKAEKISVSLNGELLAELHAAVASGDYNSTSEVIREALREWRKNREREAAIDEVRRLVAEADASGYRPYSGVDALISRKKAEAASKA
ncbi:ribbon-helix-helix domain-containing protein [Erythrobacter sp. EC-HK427]|uniref:ribbon-helix-helix domain-containing protein n=1 Tax=Erythrobacter sp. EC-HK427 TaxID=2038396 RepID=UPI00125BB225|nr:type II toxin-antitoxin system ParD family antitoxin [Erythrobacter sp. EC-HK427]VVS99339.1 conserved hypothetical protein [Erythrobacter sp. EC-HK427]